MARRRTLLALSVGLVALGVAGCGRDDFENDPRPPVAAEITVKIGDGAVTISPKEFGVLQVEGPVDAVSDQVPPNGNVQLKTELETGEYEASADGVEAKPFAFTVGEERESGQNDLLLP